MAAGGFWSRSVVQTLRKIARSRFRWVAVAPSDWAHNPKVGDSNPPPAKPNNNETRRIPAGFLCVRRPSKQIAGCGLSCYSIATKSLRSKGRPRAPSACFGEKRNTKKRQKNEHFKSIEEPRIVRAFWRPDPADQSREVSS